MLLGLSFPPLQLGFFAYWAFLPLFFLFETCSPKQALLWGYVAGFFWNLFTLYWVYVATIAGVIGLLLVLPIYVMIYGWLHVTLREKLGKNYVFLLPAIWVTIEYLRSLGSAGFPWTALAYTQTYYTDLIQYADITGVFGVSFWVFLLNIILFILLKERPPIRKTIPLILILVGLLLIPYIYGKITQPPRNYPKENIRVGLVQGNIDPYLKWSEGFVDQNFAIYDSLTHLVYKEDLDLIVWPETATASFVRNKPQYLTYLHELSDSLDVPILTGSPDYEVIAAGEYETYNSVLLFQPNENSLQSYNKMILVPFGERVPLEDTFGFLHDFLERFNMGTGDFAPGKALGLLNMELDSRRFPIAGIICYESVFPDHVRRLITLGAKLLVIVTNDGWYGNTSGPYQHAQIAVFRAIENRVSIARCANTGISSFIDPYGRILEDSEFNETYVGAMELPIHEKLTFYSRHGDVFAMLLAGLSGLAVISTFLKRRPVA